jgi:hypothetical protein
MTFYVFLVKDGSQVRFLEDNWLSGTPLKYQYPSLYNIVRPKFTTIANVLSASPLSISWRRQLFGPTSQCSKDMPTCEYSSMCNFVKLKNGGFSTLCSIIAFLDQEPLRWNDS